MNTTNKTTPSVRDMERAIVTACVKSALDEGYQISLDNGGDDYEFEFSTDKNFILSEMFATSEESLILTKPNMSRFMMFVYGNDGWDVLCDYTAILDDEGTTKEANRLSEEYQEACGVL